MKKLFVAAALAVTLAQPATSITFPAFSCAGESRCCLS